MIERSSTSRSRSLKWIAASAVAQLQTGESTGATFVPVIGLFCSFRTSVSANAAAVAASSATTSTVEAIRATEGAFYAAFTHPRPACGLCGYRGLVPQVL
jgi:hypothetical protein